MKNEDDAILRLYFKKWIPRFMYSILGKIFIHVEIEYKGTTVWIKPQYEIGYNTELPHGGGSGGTGKKNKEN